MNVWSIKRMVIEEDSINTVRFIVPKTYDSVDLTGARWYISLIADGTIGDMIELTPVSYSTTQLYVDWFLTGAATAVSGDLEFAIRAEVGAYVYQTYTQTITIDSKLDLTGTEEFTPSVLSAYRAEFEALKESAELAETNAELAESHAELAEAGAEEARDAILLDTGFQAVVISLDNINIVASIENDIGTVVDNIADVQNAEENAQLAKDYATEAEDVEVETGTYSAKHWATKAQASVEQVLNNAFEVVVIDAEEYLVYTY
jgi:hypothetical protein